MAEGGSPVKAVLYAFGANFGISIAKGVAFLYTGSSSMLAETIHSIADTGNQLLLLLGIHRAKRLPDKEHPLGYGKASYFWSFIVAILLFSIGGLFSLYEGWHKLHNTEPLRQAWVALVVLGVSIILEAFSMLGCVREINKMRSNRTLWQWLYQSRNAELVVVFGEDLAALVGLLIAFCFVAIASVTGNPFYDALGSMCIGVLLIVVATFVGIRVQSLLLGRSADPDIAQAIEQFISADPDIETVFNVITLQMGQKIMLAAKILMRPDLTVTNASNKINTLETKLKDRFPEIGWCFIEPDNTD